MIAAIKRASVLPYLLLAFSLTLVCACAGTFQMRIGTTRPGDIGSLYVLLGKAGDFADKSGTTEIVGLIKSSVLQDYVGYAEYTLDEKEEGARWRELSLDVPEQVQVQAPEEAEGPLAIRLHRGLLKPHPDLTVAVVLSSARGEFYLKTWDATFLKETDQQLIVDLSADGMATGLE